MSDLNKISELLTEDDYIYLSAAYDLDIDMVRGMNDADWCQFVGCGMTELPYYLFEDGEPMGEVEFLADEVAFDEIEDFEDTLFDLEAYLQDHAGDEPLPQAKVNSKPKVAVKPITTSYSRPSKFASKAAPKVVPHHFELVK